jgi:hypothetical protein
LKKISHKGTSIEPSVSFNADNGKLEIAGVSTPEDAINFYRPLVEWVKEYAVNPKDLTELTIKLEYFNTSTSKTLLDIFKTLQEIKEKGYDVMVKWYYEKKDDDMLETGQDYESMLNIPFDMIPW